MAEAGPCSLTMAEAGPSYGGGRTSLWRRPDLAVSLGRRPDLVVEFIKQKRFFSCPYAFIKSPWILKWITWIFHRKYFFIHITKKAMLKKNVKVWLVQVYCLYTTYKLRDKCQIFLICWIINHFILDILFEILLKASFSKYMKLYFKTIFFNNNCNFWLSFVKCLLYL